MPTVVDKPLRKRNSYPWPKWLASAKGKTATYKQGEDFDVSLNNFVSNAYGYAAAHGLECRTHRLGDGKSVQLQFLPREDAGKDGNRRPAKTQRQIASKAASNGKPSKKAKRTGKVKKAPTASVTTTTTSK